MRREPRAFLWDLREACTQIGEFVGGRSFEDYRASCSSGISAASVFESRGMFPVRRIESGMTTRRLSLRT